MEPLLSNYGSSDFFTTQVLKKEKWTKIVEKYFFYAFFLLLKTLNFLAPLS
jgi:hypothetical protein